jgi:hypothetical protein
MRRVHVQIRNEERFQLETLIRTVTFFNRLFNSIAQNLNLHF